MYQKTMVLTAALLLTAPGAFAQKKKKPAPIIENKAVETKTDDAKGTGKYGLNLKIHIFGGAGLTYPGGDTIIDVDANAAGQVSLGYEGGIGLSYMFLKDLIGINISARYSANYIRIKYSGTDLNRGTYTYKTSFIDTSIGVKGYLHFIFLYYETGLSFGIKPADWTREGPSGSEPESSWASNHDLNYNLSYYIGGGLAWPVSQLVSIEFGFRYEIGFLPIIEGPSPLDSASGTDKLTTRYAGLRGGVTFSF